MAHNGVPSTNECKPASLSFVKFEKTENNAQRRLKVQQKIKFEFSRVGFYEIKDNFVNFEEILHSFGDICCLKPGPYQGVASVTVTILAKKQTLSII